MTWLESLHHKESQQVCPKSSNISVAISIAGRENHPFSVEFQLTVAICVHHIQGLSDAGRRNHMLAGIGHPAGIGMLCLFNVSANGIVGSSRTSTAIPIEHLLNHLPHHNEADVGQQPGRRCDTQPCHRLALAVTSMRSSMFGIAWSWLTYVNLNCPSASFSHLQPSSARCVIAAPCPSDRCQGTF